MRLRALYAVLNRQKTVTFGCVGSDAGPSQNQSRSLTALDASISHEDSPVHIARCVLSQSDVDQLHAAAAELAESSSTAYHTYDNVLINNSASDLPFGLKPQHESIFLHEDGFLQRTQPELCARIIGAVRRRHSGGAPLGVRCIEYHTYRIGGGLLDPEHRDMGSTLTLSCLLTEPDTFEGGVFMTWERGETICHEGLRRGDAVAFHSERVHNVGAVMGGVRRSLVVELWEGGDNVRDRHS